MFNYSFISDKKTILSTDHEKTSLMLEFPNISPVAIAIGPDTVLSVFGWFSIKLPLLIRWYSLAYIAGILGGWWYAGRMNRRAQFMNEKQFDAILSWIVIGIVAGGRLGYVIFYNAAYFIHHPLEIFYVWQGGMSFHGGMIGTILSIYIFCRRNKLEFFRIMDVAACVSPIGLGLGRLANFINGELYGRATDSPLGMIFPNSDGLPRHPSQLYEAGLEGFLFLIILSLLFWKYDKWKKPAFLSGVFLICYAIFRIIIECFREPDAQLGFFFQYITMGQLLCIPMILLGVYLLYRAGKYAKPVTRNN